jgi:hypothetical protein
VGVPGEQLIAISRLVNPPRRASWWIPTSTLSPAITAEGGTNSRHPSKPDTGIHEPTPHPSTTNERQAARADHNNHDQHDQHDHQGSRSDGPTAALATTAVTAPVVGTAMVGTAMVGTAMVGTAMATDSRAVGRSANIVVGHR